MEIFHQGNGRKIPKPITSSLGKIESYNFTSRVVVSLTTKNVWFKSATGRNILILLKNYTNFQIGILSGWNTFCEINYIFRLQNDCFSIQLKP